MDKTRKNKSFLKVYEYSYSNVNNKNVKELEREIVVKDGEKRGRIKVRKNKDVQEHELTPQEIDDYFYKIPANTTRRTKRILN